MSSPFKMTPTRHSSVISTAVSFAVGFLFGYIIRDLFANLNRRRDKSPVDYLAQLPHLGPACCDMEDTKNSKQLNPRQKGQQEPDKVAEVVDGLAQAVIHKSQSGEDIFFDASCDGVDSDITEVIGKGNGSVSTSTAKQLLYAQVDQQLEESSADVQTIFETLKKEQATLSEDANFWWRLAKAAHLLSKCDAYLPDDKKNEKKTLMNEAVEYAEKALKLAETGNGDCHKWCAITVGALSHKSGFSIEQVKKGVYFKKHLDLALSLKSEDATLCHLEGRFYAKYLKRSSSQRFLARRFIDIPSNVTQDKVLECFMNAHKLKPSWKENILHLSKTLISLKRPSEAAKYIQEGLDLPVFNHHESLVHFKLKELAQNAQLD